MPEPLYNYVKGEGWIPQAPCTFISKDGVYEVTLEMKVPETGDRYWEWDGSLDGSLEKLKEIVRRYTYPEAGGTATGLETQVVAVYTLRKL